MVGRGPDAAEINVVKPGPERLDPTFEIVIPAPDASWFHVH
jgi:hypothetical protein